MAAFTRPQSVRNEAIQPTLHQLYLCKDDSHYERAEYLKLLV
jgi:hypothetical protein